MLCVKFKWKCSYEIKYPQVSMTFAIIYDNFKMTIIGYIVMN